MPTQWHHISTVGSYSQAVRGEVCDLLRTQLKLILIGPALRANSDYIAGRAHSASDFIINNDD